MILKKSIFPVVASSILSLCLLAQNVNAGGVPSSASLPLDQTMFMFTDTGEIEAKQKLSDYQGDVILVEFWATHCGYCKDNFPKLSALSERYADQGLKVIAVSTDSDRDRLVEYIKREAPGVQIAWDLSDLVSSGYNIEHIPHTILLDRSGNIIHQQIGAFSAADVDVLNQKIRSAI